MPGKDVLARRSSVERARGSQRRQASENRRSTTPLSEVRRERKNWCGTDLSTRERKERKRQWLTSLAEMKTREEKKRG